MKRGAPPRDFRLPSGAGLQRLGSKLAPESGFGGLMNGFWSGAGGIGFSGPDLVGREALKTRFPVRLPRLNGPRMERTPRGGRSRPAASVPR